MSTLNVTLSSDATITTVPAQQVTLAAGNIEIEEIIDTPGSNSVEVWHAWQDSNLRPTV